MSDVVIHYDDEGEATKLTKEPSRRQKGRVVGISTPMTKDGKMNVYAMEWKSQVEKRVCRSTLAAETYAIASGVEAADCMRLLVQEIRDVSFNIAEVERAQKGCEVVMAE